MAKPDKILKWDDENVEKIPVEYGYYVGSSNEFISSYPSYLEICKTCRRARCWCRCSWRYDD